MANSIKFTNFVDISMKDGERFDDFKCDLSFANPEYSDLKLEFFGTKNLPASSTILEQTFQEFNGIFVFTSVSPDKKAQKGNYTINKLAQFLNGKYYYIHDRNPYFLAWNLTNWVITNISKLQNIQECEPCSFEGLTIGEIGDVSSVLTPDGTSWTDGTQSRKNQLPNDSIKSEPVLSYVSIIQNENVVIGQIVTISNQFDNLDDNSINDIAIFGIIDYAENILKGIYKTQHILRKFVAMYHKNDKSEIVFNLENIDEISENLVYFVVKNNYGQLQLDKPFIAKLNNIPTIHNGVTEQIDLVDSSISEILDKASIGLFVYSNRVIGALRQNDSFYTFSGVSTQLDGFFTGTQKLVASTSSHTTPIPESIFTAPEACIVWNSVIENDFNLDQLQGENLVFDEMGRSGHGDRLILKNFRRIQKIDASVHAIHPINPQFQSHIQWKSIDYMLDGEIILQNGKSAFFTNAEINSRGSLKISLDSLSSTIISGSPDAAPESHLIDFVTYTSLATIVIRDNHFAIKFLDFDSEYDYGTIYSKCLGLDLSKYQNESYLGIPQIWFIQKGQLVLGFYDISTINPEGNTESDTYQTLVPFIAYFENSDSKYFIGSIYQQEIKQPTSQIERGTTKKGSYSTCTCQDGITIPIHSDSATCTSQGSANKCENGQMGSGCFAISDSNIFTETTQNCTNHDSKRGSSYFNSIEQGFVFPFSPGFLFVSISEAIYQGDVLMADFQKEVDIGEEKMKKLTINELNFDQSSQNWKINLKIDSQAFSGTGFQNEFYQMNKDSDHSVSTVKFSGEILPSKFLSITISPDGIVCLENSSQQTTHKYFVGVIEVSQNWNTFKFLLTKSCINNCENFIISDCENLYDKINISIDENFTKLDSGNGLSNINLNFIKRANLNIGIIPNQFSANLQQQHVFICRIYTNNYRSYCSIFGGEFYKGLMVVGPADIDNQDTQAFILKFNHENFKEFTGSNTNTITYKFKDPYDFFKLKNIIKIQLLSSHLLDCNGNKGDLWISDKNLYKKAKKFMARDKSEEPFVMNCNKEENDSDSIKILTWTDHKLNSFDKKVYLTSFENVGCPVYMPNLSKFGVKPNFCKIPNEHGETGCKECFTQEDIAYSGHIFNDIKVQFASNNFKRTVFPTSILEFLQKGVTDPFILDTTTGECIPSTACHENYRNSSIGCISNNCKSLVFGKSSSTCESCWNNEDLEKNQELKSTYHPDHMRFRDDQNPFILKNNVCILNCRKNFWSSYSYGYSLDPFNQYCISDNCKPMNKNLGSAPVYSVINNFLF